MQIILVRHGETEWNRIGRFQGRSDVPLNEKGKSQVEALGRELQYKPLTAIYSSPLVRAVETAESIRLHHPAIVLKQAQDLIEMDLGEYEGMHFMDWAEKYPDVRRKWLKNPSTVRMPGGENLKTVQTRAVHCLEKITEQHTDQDSIAICSHNFVIVAILCHALDIDLDRFREIKLETASFSILRKQSDRLWVDTINRQADVAAV